MLTDVILEEEFEKKEEPWYNQRDLENGKRTRPKLRHFTPWVSERITGQLFNDLFDYLLFLYK